MILTCHPLKLVTVIVFSIAMFGARLMGWPFTAIRVYNEELT